MWCVQLRFDCFRMLNIEAGKCSSIVLRLLDFHSLHFILICVWWWFTATLRAFGRDVLFIGCINAEPKFDYHSIEKAVQRFDWMQREFNGQLGCCKRRSIDERWIAKRKQHIDQEYGGNNRWRYDTRHHWNNVQWDHQQYDWCIIRQHNGKSPTDARRKRFIQFHNELGGWICSSWQKHAKYERNHGNYCRMVWHSATSARKSAIWRRILCFLRNILCVHTRDARRATNRRRSTHWLQKYPIEKLNVAYLLAVPPLLSRICIKSSPNTYLRLSFLSHILNERLQN